MRIVTDSKVVIYGGSQEENTLTLDNWAEVHHELTLRDVPGNADIKVTHSNGRGGWTVIATWNPEEKSQLTASQTPS